MWAVVADAVMGAAGGAVGWLIGWALVRKVDISGERQKAVRLLPLVVCVVGSAQMGRSLDLAERLEMRFSGIPHWQALVWAEAKPLTRHPEFVRRVASATGIERSKAIGEITRAGLRRLSSDELLIWAAVKLKLAESSPPLCAAMWWGAPDTTLLMTEAMPKLPEDDQRTWAKLIGLAGRLELDGPAGAAPSADPLPGIMAVGRTLDSPAAQEFERDLALGLEQISEQRACEMMKTVLKGAAKLDRPVRDDLLRALVSA